MRTPHYTGALRVSSTVRLGVFVIRLVSSTLKYRVVVNVLSLA